ncbi:MAG: hypothetical protein QXG39_00405 [Candidatus Aenigmatarchaeota archaeon]
MGIWDNLKEKLEKPTTSQLVEQNIQNVQNVQPQQIQIQSQQPQLQPAKILQPIPGTPIETVADFSQFKLEEAELPTKLVITIYGDKGDGKTTFAEGIGGKIVVLSFDRKSTAPKINYHNNDSNIRIFDAVKYWDRDASKVLDSSEKTYQYVCFILDELKKRGEIPDWIIVDGIEIFQKIAEFIMRKRHGLLPYQGIANMNVWKERNSIIDDLHQRCFSLAKKGVIYTTYSDFSEIVEEGSVVTREKVPRYLDTVMWETDIVLYIEKQFDSKSKTARFMLRCDSSKFDNVIKTGTWIDITGKKANEVLNLNSFFKSIGG